MDRPRTTDAIPQRDAPRPVSRRRAIARTVAVLVTGLAVTGLVSRQVMEEEGRAIRARFDRYSERVLGETARAMNLPMHGLRGIRGLFDASKSVERTEFRKFVASHDLATEYPGVAGFGFVQVVNAGDLAAFTAAERADDAPDFTVRTDNIRDQLLYVVKFMEPAVNPTDAPGYNVRLIPARRDAVERALATAEPAMSAPLDLVRPGGRRPAVTMYLPVYKVGAELSSPQSRGANLLGLAYAPIVLEDALASLEAFTDGFVDVEVVEAGDEDLLFDLDKGLSYAGHRRFRTQATLDIAGRTWIVRVAATPRFHAQFDQSGALGTCILGAALSISAAMGVLVLSTGQARASALALGMTAELRDAQHRTAESELRLRSILAAEPECVKVLAPDGTLEFMNRAGLDMIEAGSMEDIRSYGLERIVLPEHLDSFSTHIARALAGERGILRFEVQGLKGTRRWLESHIVPMRDANGAITSTLSVTRDISAQLIAERRMAESEARTRLIIDTALDAVVAMDEQGVVTQWNAQAETMFGWSAGDAIGRPMHLLIVPERLREAHLSGLARFRATGVGSILSTRIEVPAVRKDGSEITVELAITPVRSGNSLWFSAFLRDITERQKAANRLAESESRFRTLADSAPMMIWTTGTDSGGDYFNRAWLEFTGRTMAQELGEGWTGNVHPDDADRCLAAYRDAFVGREPVQVEYRLRRYDGSFRTVLSRGVPRTAEDGAFAGYIGACWDVTELREAQQRAEAANRAKSEFLANVSHEIRTPLTAILGFSDLLRDDGTVPITPDQRAQAIDTIATAGQHLLTVINDILDLSKIEANKVTVERVEVHLPRILLEVGALMRPWAQRKGVHLDIALDTPIPERIHADPTRLRQILLNLLGNAVKFTDRGSIRISAAVAGDRLLVDIIDTGPGLSDDDAARLFQPFTQGDASITRKHGGTGLGLTISRRLAELMGGDVRLVRSAPGQGAQFRLEVPLDRAAGAVDVGALAATGAQDKPEADSMLHGRILLAEDGEDNRRLLAFFLRKAGVTVDLAENGEQALAMICAAERHARTYDLLLTDMQMPVMDGYTLVRELRSLSCTIPILALTAHAAPEDRRRCLDAGCDECLCKPIDRAALLAACARWMNRSNAAAA